ncbi:hypothetical protein AX769_02290 [Frondihabitans sp. PAMC 28766]|uniref:glycosyltransferase family 4 protein n=1 Tax=Frondihabitans sp. PAMC 28766 TaxID=1795630 RepID=UPI00078D9016|nr:glycosyltransferase family 4 protein [Frondihabitans sp. PAMC 28766]AMM19172.1 hypothetical protein AX769_02290 [Frondihabitans sp. PAMC 28766]
MRIVYLHQHFRTPSQNGGVRSFQFASALAARGHDVQVVTSSSGPRGPRLERIEGFTVHRLPVDYDGRMSYRRRLAAFAAFAVRSSTVARRLKADVVIATSTPLTIAIPGIVASFGRRCPMVFEVRDAWPDVPIALGALTNPLLKGAARLLERVAYRRASTVVALSADMAEAVVRAGKPRDRVAVVTNIADVAAFDPARAESERWLADHPELIGRKLAVYCGTFGYVNGLSFLVDLATASRAQGSDLAFVAIGDGPEKDAVRARALASGVLGDNLHLFEPVSKRQLPDVLAAATVAFSFVIDVPELEANSANKFFDSLAAQTPMVINHGGWQAEVLAETGAGLRLSRDAALAARQLGDFVGDEAGVAAAIRSAAELGRGRYSLDELAWRFCDIVERDGTAAGRA